MQPTPRHTPPDPPLLSQTLRDAISAANTRAEEGQRIFGPISALWDDYIDSDTVRQLPVRLCKPLLALCYEMSRIATGHFDAYLKGQKASQASYTPKPPASIQPESATDSSPLRTQPSALPPTYAQKTAQAPLLQPIQAPKTRKASVKEPAKPRPDSRLFIRISPEHKARKTDSFAILVALKELLGTNSTLIREVQEVPTGFVLYTESLEALNKLEGHTEAIIEFFEDCIIQKQISWTTYRLTNVLRTVNTLDGLDQIINNKVTDRILANTIQELIGQAAIRAVETKESAESSLFNSS